MTTRYSGFQVTLKDDIREDDAKAVINAIRMVKGVVDVRPIETKYSTEAIRDRIATSERLNQMARELLK